MPAGAGRGRSVGVMRPAHRLLPPVVIALALLGTGCASGGGTAQATASAPATASTLVAPEAFAARMDGPGVVTVNVHTPDEGSIAGTDLTIAFDRIATSSELPADRATPLAVYCRSGNMSATAVQDLQARGYTDVVELDGGFNAWKASGRPLEPGAGR